MLTAKPTEPGIYDNHQLIQRERWDAMNGELKLVLSTSKAAIDSGSDWHLTSSGQERIQAVPWGNYPDYTAKIASADIDEGIEIWAEGYVTNGETSPARLLGKFTAQNFREAVEEFRDSLADDRSRNTVNLDTMTFWGCKLYDNENAARKSFG